MRARVKPLVIVGVLLLAMPSPSLAGITVSSFTTQAQANAYAPLDRSAYFVTDDRPNVTPATASVSEDWTGTNIGGSANTWHMLASASFATTTAASANTLNVTGAGGFSYDITTTAGFIDPTSVTTLYGPGAAAGYTCSFTVTESASYAISARLSFAGSVTLASLGAAGVVFQQLNAGPIPQTVNVSGIIGPGQYQFTTGAAAGGPTGLPTGVNHISMSGGASDVQFSIQVPEPCLTYVFLGMSATMFSRRLRTKRVDEGKCRSIQVPPIGAVESALVRLT